MNTPLVPRSQRGAAALVVTALLFFAMLLAVAAANRNIVVEAHSSSNQYRSTQAFEAAEAGLEWSLAKLNDDTPLGEDCLPSAAAGAASFRDRHLHYDVALDALAPTSWNDGGTSRTLQAACVRDEAGWRCSCPAAGAPVFAAVAGTTTAPAFVVELSSGARPGLIVAVATGCTTSATACAATSDASHEAAARIEVAFGLVPALRAAPVAALTTRGNVDAGAASLGLRFSDGDSGGIAVDAGGHVTGSALRVVGPAGPSLGGSIVADDEALAGLDEDRFFARWFGMGKAAWAAQPTVARIDCAADCADAVAAAIAHGHRMIDVQGDLLIEGPVTFASAEQPVVLVVSGALRLRGAAVLTGLVYAASIDWHDASAGAAINGAVVSGTTYSGDAAADLNHDRQALRRLHGSRGTFARVAGSWKDF